MCSRHSCYFKPIVFLLLIMLGDISMQKFIWAIDTSYFRWSFSSVFCAIRKYEIVTCFLLAYNCLSRFKRMHHIPKMLWWPRIKLIKLPFYLNGQILIQIKDNDINYRLDTGGNCENDLRTKIIYMNKLLFLRYSNAGVRYCMYRDKLWRMLKHLFVCLSKIHRHNMQFIPYGAVV